MRLRLLFLSSLCLLLACGDDDTPDPTPDATGGCTTAADCDDGIFCNGDERCEGGMCRSGDLPCAAASCDEASATCDGVCLDQDEDGAADARCGGTDCDDANPDRYPGATEVCDAADLDEDCDPSTFGFRDLDMDGAPDAACCNGANCGTDCDDAAPAINPLQDESCDDVDNDCDGNVDEEVGNLCYADADGDSYAPAGASSVLRCDCEANETDRETPLDCRDEGASASQIFPGATEVCNHLDEDCDGRFDESTGTDRCDLQVSIADIGGDASRWDCYGSGGNCASAPFTRPRARAFGYLTNATGTVDTAAAIVLPETVDLGHRLSLRASWWVRLPAGWTSANEGQVSVFASPGTPVGLTNVTQDVGGAPTPVGTVVATIDLVSRRVSIWHAVSGTGWVRLAQSTDTLPGTCGFVTPSAEPTVFPGLTLEITDGAARATVTCGSPAIRAMAEATIPDWRATYYDGPTPPQFSLGAGAATTGEADTGVAALRFERDQDPGGHMGLCVDCRSYGRGGLSY